MRAAVFGAGGGIGAALVAALATRPDVALVHALARRPGPGGAGVDPMPFDLADEAGLARAAEAMGPLDLVIVATGALAPLGGQGPEKTLRALDGAAMAEMFRINAIGPALIARHVLPRLPRERRSVFAVLSARVGSIADNRLGGWHSYRASKAALNMLVHNFAIELARTHPGAICVSLHPGTVATSLSEPFHRALPPERLFTPERAAGQLLTVIDGLRPADSGGFFAWDGQSIPW